MEKTINLVNVATPNDWVIPSNPSQTKGPDEFDVIIVGSGIGGLSCGALLAKSGYKVLVLEQYSKVGGYCSSYTRDGFIFNVGVEDVSGLWEHGVTLQLLNILGLNKDDFFIRNTRLFILDDKKILITGTKDDFIEQFSKQFPQEKAALNAFLDEAQQILVQDQKSPAFMAWATTTYQQKLDEFFKDKKLKTFLCALLDYIGTTPDKTPAIYAAYACLQYFIYGGSFTKNGGHHFATALKDIIETNCGTVFTNCKVDQITVEDNQVTGVRASDHLYKSSIVVANVNARTTFLNLVPHGAIAQDFIDAVAQLKMSISVIVVHLGVDMDLSHLPSLINKLDEKNQCYMLISSNVDAKTAPAGKANISLLSIGNYELTPPMNTPEYAQFKESCVQKALATAEEIIPDLSKHILVKDVLTPRSFEHITSMPEGAAYSFDQAIGNQRPYFKTPLKGLYLSSSSTTGGGIEPVIMAGLQCAADILSAQKIE